jgi:thioesterase domain-containing protein/acyl carrier protein
LALLGEPQLLVSKANLELRLDQWVRSREAPTRLKPAENAHARPNFLSPVVEARDDIERNLVEIWQNLFTFAPIGIRDNFFDLGGHSLMMTQLVSRLRTVMKVHIPLRSLVELPTIEQMAEAIREMTHSEPRETRDSRLVEIQSGDSNPPVFFVHPLGGGVSIFIDLARYLKPGRPFYAFQAADLHTLSEIGSPYSSIENMASHYLKELLKIQAEGPYFLGGLSFGGQVAFEMARQLSAEGRKVAFLGLLDTFAPNPFAPVPDDKWILVGFVRELVSSTGKNIDLTSDELSDGDQEQNIMKALNRLKAENLVPQNTDLPTVKALLKGIRMRIDLSRNYSPKTYAGKITLFRATDISPEIKDLADTEDVSYGWNRFSDREVEIIEVPGNHSTICFPPNVEKLANSLSSSLEKTRYAITSKTHS